MPSGIVKLNKGNIMKTQEQVNLKTWETMDSLNKQDVMLTDAVKQLNKIVVGLNEVIVGLDRRVKQLEKKQ